MLLREVRNLKPGDIIRLPGSADARRVTMVLGDRSTKDTNFVIQTDHNFTIVGNANRPPLRESLLHGSDLVEIADVPHG